MVFRLFFANNFILKTVMLIINLCATNYLNKILKYSWWTRCCCIFLSLCNSPIDQYILKFHACSERDRSLSIDVVDKVSILI